MGCGASKPVQYEAMAARVCEGGTRLPAEATYCWMRKPGSNEWEGEWRSGTSKDAPKEMGAESMLYSLVNIDVVAAPPAAAPAAAPASEGSDMARDMARELVSGAADIAGFGGVVGMVDVAAEAHTAAGALSGAPAPAPAAGDVKANEGEPQTIRPAYELRGKEGTVAWSFKLVDLTGTLDVKTLKGEKAVCALLTAPGRSAYKLVKLKCDVYKLAVKWAMRAGPRP